jgi:hypothetical protein
MRSTLRLTVMGWSTRSTWGNERSRVIWFDLMQILIEVRYIRTASCSTERDLPESPSQKMQFIDSPFDRALSSAGKLNLPPSMLLTSTVPTAGAIRIPDGYEKASVLDCPLPIS